MAIKEGAAQWGGEVGIRWEETTRTTTADDDGPSGTSDRRRSKTCLVTFGRAFASSSPSSAAVGPAQLVRLHLISPARIFAVLPPSAETGIAPPAGPRAPVPIADLPHLSALLASVLQACLVRGIVDFVAGLERLSPAATAAAAAAAGSETAPARRSCCFPHDAKSLAVLQWTRGQLSVRLHPYPSGNSTDIPPWTTPALLSDLHAPQSFFHQPASPPTLPFRRSRLDSHFIALRSRPSTSPRFTLAGRQARVRVLQPTGYSRTGSGLWRIDDGCPR